jgi:hypothetical protein
MNRRIQRLRSRERPLWKRILDRYKFRGHLLRVRVSLVLLRLRSAEVSRRPGISPQRNVSSSPLHLHLQLSWPHWLINPYAASVTFENSTFRTTVIRDFKRLLQTPRNTSMDSNPEPDLSATPSAEAKRNAATTLYVEQRRNADPVASRGRETKTRSAFPITRVGRTHPITSQHIPLVSLTAGPSPASGQNTRGASALPLFTHTLVSTNERHNVFSTRDIFVPRLAPLVALAPLAPVARLTEKIERVQSAGPVTAALKRTGLQQLRRNDTTQRASVNGEMKTVAGPSVQTEFVHRARTDGDHGSSLTTGRRRLYSEPAALNFANHRSFDSTERAEPKEPPRLRQPPATVQPAQPQLDISRLSDEVYRHIQRKIRVERERRGL